MGEVCFYKVDCVIHFMLVRPPFEVQAVQYYKLKVMLSCVDVQS